MGVGRWGLYTYAGLHPAANCCGSRQASHACVPVCNRMAALRQLLRISGRSVCVHMCVLCCVETRHTGDGGVR